MDKAPTKLPRAPSSEVPGTRSLLREAFRRADQLPAPEHFPIIGTSVVPSPMPGRFQLTDVAMTSLLNVHMTTINAGKQLIWQRYNVMLTANSILLGLVGKENTGGVPVVVVHGVGLTLCAAWSVISVGGWAYSTKRLRIAAGFRWEALGDDANPGSALFAPVVKTGLKKDSIFLAAMGIILAFAAAHGWLLMRALR